MNRNIILIIIICALFSTGILTWADVRPAKVFFINCLVSYMDISVRNPENGEVFSRNGISPVSMTPYAEVEKYGKYNIFFKHAGTDEWYFWQNGSGKPVSVPIEAGNIYCILMQHDGTVDYFILQENDGTGARISFINACKDPMEKMEVGEDWNTGTVAMAVNLDTYAITHFVSAKPGNYGLFYKPSNSENYFTLEGAVESKLVVVPFLESNYYVFLLYEDDNIRYPYIFDISPEKEIASEDKEE